MIPTSTFAASVDAVVDPCEAPDRRLLERALCRDADLHGPAVSRGPADGSVTITFAIEVANFTAAQLAALGAVDTALHRTGFIGAVDAVKVQRMGRSASIAEDWHPLDD